MYYVERYTFKLLGKYDYIAEYNALGNIKNLEEVKGELGGRPYIYKISSAEYEPLNKAIEYLKQR